MKRRIKGMVFEREKKIINTGDFRLDYILPLGPLVQETLEM